MENKDRKETPKEKEPKKSPEARIEELIETGKQNGVLTYKEVMDTLNELELDAEQIERIYDRWRPSTSMWWMRWRCPRISTRILRRSKTTSGGRHRHRRPGSHVS